MVVRDVDLLAELARGRLPVFFSITTVDRHYGAALSGTANPFQRCAMPLAAGVRQA
jgi:hypothetical protein